MKYELFNKKAFDELEGYRQQHQMSLTELERQTGVSRMSFRHWLDDTPNVIRDTTQAKIIAFNQTHGLYTGKD